MMLLLKPSAEAKHALIMAGQEKVMETDVMLEPNRQAAAPVRVAFWNVENFFYPGDDTASAYDDAYTAEGGLHWTWGRFRRKRDVIYKTIVAMGLPAVVGLAEVEDSNVLNQLCLSTPLRRIPYHYIHFDSPDRRGIDCALLYRAGAFEPFEWWASGFSDSVFRTRDVLVVGGRLVTGDTLYCLVNHWPSRLGGEESRRRREAIGAAVEGLADSLMGAHPSAEVVVMGDFNRELRRGEGEGSYKYEGAWEWIDHIFVFSAAGEGAEVEGFPFARLASRFRRLVCRVFAGRWLLAADERYLGLKPLRTYAGPRYVGGASDHLPVYVDLAR